MINTQPFIDKLDMLPAYIEYWINNPTMSLPHKFYTKSYNFSARRYFIGNFRKLGWKIGKDTMIRRRKTFEQWLLTNKPPQPI